MYVSIDPSRALKTAMKMKEKSKGSHRVKKTVSQRYRVSYRALSKCDGLMVRCFRQIALSARYVTRLQPSTV
jgi:hypothetical protein